MVWPMNMVIYEFMKPAGNVHERVSMTASAER